MSHPRPAGPPTSEGRLDRLLQLLAEPPASMGPAPAMGAARDRTRDSLLLPWPGRPRLVVPGDRRSAGAVRAYNRLRPARLRAARTATSLVLRTGLLQRVPRLLVGVVDPDGDGYLLSALGRRLDAGPLGCVVSLERAGAFRKPVLQLVDAGGRTVGFCKLATNPVTSRLVSNEAVALDALARREGALPFGWTRLLDAGEWQGHPYLVTAPMPPDVRRRRHELAPPLGATAALSTASGSPRAVGEGPWAADVASRVEAIAATAWGHGVDEWWRGFLARHGATAVPHGWWHGDWSPWNLGTAATGLVAWDWEYAAADRPAGLDVVHYEFQRRFIGARDPLDSVLAATAAAAGPSLVAIGLDREQGDATIAAHRVEMAVRYAEAGITGGTTNARLYPALLEHGFA
jgi:hypothetical protein